MIRPPRQRGRSLERTLEPRRKRVHSSTRSGSRRSKHHDHYYQKLHGGSSKPIKTASMLAMMLASPFFIIFMQVFSSPSPLSLLVVAFSLPILPLSTSQQWQHVQISNSRMCHCYTTVAIGIVLGAIHLVFLLVIAIVCISSRPDLSRPSLEMRCK